jgi:hypothetical protein
MHFFLYLAPSAVYPLANQTYLLHDLMLNARNIFLHFSESFGQVHFLLLIIQVEMLIYLDCLHQILPFLAVCFLSVAGDQVCVFCDQFGPLLVISLLRVAINVSEALTDDGDEQVEHDDIRVNDA